MRLTLCLLTILTVSVHCFGQLPVIDTDRTLLSALLLLKSSEVSKGNDLLKNHKNLITIRLIQDLIVEADHLSQPWNKSNKLFLLQMAKEAATLIEESKFVGYSLYEMAFCNFINGDSGQAERELLESKSYFEKSGDSADLINVLSELGNVYLYQENFPAARDYSLKSIELSEKLPLDEAALIAPVPYGIAIARLNLGDIHKAEGEYEQAIDQFQKGLVILELLSRISPKYKGDVADALAEIGRLYRVTGNNTEALGYLSQAMDLTKSISQREKLAGVLNSIGVLYSEQNDYGKAIDYYQQ